MTINHRFFYYALLLAAGAAVFSAPYAMAAESGKDASAPASAADASAEKKDDEKKDKHHKDKKHHDKEKDSAAETTPVTPSPAADANKGQPAAPAATAPAEQPTGLLVDPSATPEATGEAASDPYSQQRKKFSDACTRICKLLREGNYPSALYLCQHIADDLSQNKINGSDPFPSRSAHLLQILKDCGPDTDALDKAFQKEAHTYEGKGDNPNAQVFYSLQDQLENGGTPIAAVPAKVVVNNEQNEEAVRAEMRLIHAVLKKYGKEHNGKYPLSLDPVFKKYFVNLTIGGTKVARPFTNPFNQKGEWFEVKPIEDLGKATAMTSIPKGKIWYCPLTNANDYAIIAGDHIEHQIRDPKTNQPLIISRYIVEDKTIIVPDVMPPQPAAGKAKKK